MTGGKKPEKKIDPEEKPIKDDKWTASDTGHLALDVLGMVPGVGEVADGLNASWYAKKGKYGDAALSGAAMIPGAGWAAGGTKIALVNNNRLSMQNDFIICEFTKILIILNKTAKRILFSFCFKR